MVLFKKQMGPLHATNKIYERNHVSSWKVMLLLEGHIYTYIVK